MFGGKMGLLYLTLAVLFVIVFIASLGVGRYTIAPGDILAMLRGRSGDGMDARVFWAIRLPRLLCAMLTGAALSVSGAAYQSVFRNPLVSPDILGAAAGAGFGAAAAIMLGLGKAPLQFLAFASGLAGVLISYFAGLRFTGRGRDGAVTLVLCGMVVTAVFSALTSGVKLIADPYDELPAITFWLMGGLSYVTAEDIQIMLPPLAIGFAALFLTRHRLNVLSLPDEEIEAIGVNAKLNRGAVVLCATLLTSASVAVGGMIAWVGLIVPHAARLLAGPDNRTLLPVSLLCGMVFLMLADDICRTLFAVELPLGILTALAGAPLFLILLGRSGKG